MLIKPRPSSQEVPAEPVLEYGADASERTTERCIVYAIAVERT